MSKYIGSCPVYLISFIFICCCLNCCCLIFRTLILILILDIDSRINSYVVLSFE